MLRRALQVAAAGGALLLAAGVCVGFAQREAAVDLATTALLVVGTSLAVGAMAVAVLLERAPDGLVVPAGERLPVPAFGGPLLLVALCDLLGGAYASTPALVVGALLLIPALWWVSSSLRRLRLQQAGQSGRPAASGTAFDLTTDATDPAHGAQAARETGPATHVADGRVSGRVDRATVVAARRLLAFGRRHVQAGDARIEAAVEHTGHDQARIVVVGRDGAYGDVLVLGLARARRAVTLAGATERDAVEREFAGRIRTGRADWQRMGGRSRS